ncbi:MAG: efflux RND transporter permease subunit [Psychrobium sp.]
MSTSSSGLTALALKRPVTTFMIALSMLLLGLASARLLPLEKFPGIDIPEMYINAPYPGSSPAEVERLVTKPIEEALATMSGITRMNSNSNERGAGVFIEVEWSKSLTSKGIEAREKIDAIRHLLPEDLERIFVYQFSTSDMPILTMRISSERELRNSYDLLNNFLKKPIERISGVSKVELYGVDPRQIIIRLSSDRMASHNINVAQLTAVLSKQNFSINAGAIKSDNQTMRVSPQGEYTNLNDIRNFKINDHVYLSDIATVKYEQKELEEARHLNQSFAIGMDVFRESSVNLVDVASRVSTTIDEIARSDKFQGIDIFLMDDQAKGVKDSLGDLLQAGGIGAILSFAVLYLFIRNTPVTLLVVTSVPFSICLTLAGMHLMGYSLNILSMMGLLLAVGMLVDNSVVITESIAAQYKKDPTKPINQIIEFGVSKVSLAVITGTATTMIVFLPNIIGEKVQLTIFLEHVAIAICISLAASLLVAKTLLPLLLSRMDLQKLLPKEKKNDVNKPSRHYYQRSLDWVLHHPKITGVIAFIILASTAIPFSVITSDNNNSDDTTRIRLHYHLKGQYPLEEVEKLVNKMEDYLYGNQDKFEIDSVYTYFNTEYANSTLLLKEGKEKSVDEIKRLIREEMPKFAIAEPQFSWRSASAGGASLSLTGPSTDKLIELSDQVIPLLSQVEGLTDVRSEVDEQQQEMVLIVDRQKASRYNLSSQDVASLVSNALRGRNLRSFRHDPQGEVRIEMLFERELKYSLAKLKQIPITQFNDQIITLENLVRFEVRPRLNNIWRQNRMTSLRIGANLDDITIEQAGDRIKQAMENVNLPQGYNWKLGQGFERQQQEQNIMLVNMMLAVAMIYIVMAALFESLLLPAAIISSIIYSIVGVFWVFLMTGTNMGVMGMIGILILMGIVVNNGIVLIDQINQMSPKREELEKVVSDICITRLRPVLMTVATTVLGMVPLAMGSAQIGGDGPSYGPLAIAIIGGLSFSTITSLYLVPWLYLVLSKTALNTSVGVGKASKFARRFIPS